MCACVVPSLSVFASARGLAGSAAGKVLDLFLCVSVHMGMCVCVFYLWLCVLPCCKEESKCFPVFAFCVLVMDK